MKTAILYLSALFIFLSQSSPVFSGQNDGELSAEEIYKRYSNAVVFIFTYDEDMNLISFGSGVIVSPDGIIYTNHHVVDGSSFIKIKQGTVNYDSVKIVSIDKDNDAAILKISYTGVDYISVEASRVASIGETVYSFGNPDGYERTIAKGLLSGVRSIEGQDLLQFTASISPGSSGGALLNCRGKLIGITNSSQDFDRNQNLNFAVPVEKYESILPEGLCDTSNANMLNDIWKLYLDNSFEYDIKTADSLLGSLTSDSNIHKPGELETARIFKCFKKYDKSVNLLDKLIENEPDNKYLYNMRSFCSKELDSSFSSLTDLNYLLLLDSTDADVYFKRADLLRSVFLYNDAIKDYSKVIELKPDYFGIFLNRAECYIETDNRELALKDLARSTWKGITDYNTYVYRAMLYERLNSYLDAAYDYTSALILFDNYDLYYRRGLMYSKMEEHNKAMNDYMTYLARNPIDASAYNNLAYCFIAAEDYDAAEKNFRKALVYDKKHVDSYLGLAIIYYKQNKLREMMMSMAEAIKIEKKLLRGLDGLNKLKERGFFWGREEQECLLKIFEIMGIEEKHDPSNKRAVRTKAQNRDDD